MAGGVLTASTTHSYETCPRQYHYRATDWESERPSTPRQLRDELLARTMVLYHMGPAGAPGALPLAECLAAAAAEMTAAGPAALVQAAVDDLTPLLVDYVRRVVPRLGPDARTSPYVLMADVGPITLVAPLGLTWTEGDGATHSAQWVGPETPPARRLLDAAIRRACLRAAGNTSPIHHYAVQVGPRRATLEEIPLDPPLYRATLGQIWRVWHRMGRDRRWAPEPGAHCVACEFSDRCDASAAAIGDVPY